MKWQYFMLEFTYVQHCNAQPLKEKNNKYAFLIFFERDHWSGGGGTVFKRRNLNEGLPPPSCPVPLGHCASQWWTSPGNPAIHETWRPSAFYPLWTEGKYIHFYTILQIGCFTSLEQHNHDRILIPILTLRNGRLMTLTPSPS